MNFFNRATSHWSHDSTLLRTHSTSLHSLTVSLALAGRLSLLATSVLITSLLATSLADYKQTKQTKQKYKQDEGLRQAIACARTAGRVCTPAAAGLALVLLNPACVLVVVGADERRLQQAAAVFFSSRSSRSGLLFWLLWLLLLLLSSLSQLHSEAVAIDYLTRRTLVLPLGISSYLPTYLTCSTYLKWHHFHSPSPPACSSEKLELGRLPVRCYNQHSRHTHFQPTKPAAGNKMLTFLSSLLCASIATALPTISAKGAKFFTSDGDQWFIKGVAYQLLPDDPLVDTNQCQLDAALMKTLGANAIRVYHVDSSADHDGCMQAFEDAGIYVFLDLDTFDTYVLPGEPTWDSTQYDAFSKVVDAFHTYDNVAGFFVGNELINGGADSIAAPYVKAAARDMKAYRDSKGYRNIPIGYSAADIAVLRPNLQNYMACGDDPAGALDFFR